ncbi:MAG: pilus assembly protein [Acidimicrobiales bacterium]|nr:pilus assembly protein [Acidimicrobiales bacterium]MDG2218147.1 pilus assembly protein [Acidimicrobiales bacterium]
MGERHRRMRGDSGAVIVESAIITPLLMLFVFGIFEFGFAFRDYLAVANSARDGAREASVAADAADADYRMLRSIQRASVALPDGVIERIVIWEAAGPTDTVPTSCKNGTPVTGICNVYDAADLSVPEYQFGCQEIASGDLFNSPDRFWCPIDRKVIAGSGLDFVGVYVQITHDYITGFFGDSVEFDDHIVLKVEPQDAS